MLQLLVTVRVSDAEVQETVDAVTLALGAPALHADTVMEEGVVAAKAGVASGAEKATVEAMKRGMIMRRMGTFH